MHAATYPAQLHVGTVARAPPKPNIYNPEATAPISTTCYHVAKEADMRHTLPQAKKKFEKTPPPHRQTLTKPIIHAIIGAYRSPLTRFRESGGNEENYHPNR